MIKAQGYIKARKASSNGKSLIATITKEVAEEMGIEANDKLYIAVEEIKGKKRIIIERV